ncbi:MAG TPA: MFS transporter [Anaerolineae bacterium]|nr:MFS transporter [Anaerolineae bacterium]
MARSNLRTPPAPAAAAAAWLTLAVLLLFSIAAPLNQFKVPPIMPVLMETLGLTVSGAGLVMSVYAITGLILALPAGLIYAKAGPRLTGILAGGSIVLGSALGALSSGTGALLASRVIEGIGTSFMAVLAPAIIAQWFSARRRGTAMGIWAVWVPVGTAAMLILAPSLAQAAGWRAVWWLGAVYALVVTLLYLAFVRPAPRAPSPLPGRAAAARGAHRRQEVTAAQVLRNGNIWLLAGAFAAFNGAAVGLGTYMPTFLTSEHGLPLAQAALISSILTLVTIFSAPAGGVLSDRIGSRKRPYLVGLAAGIVLLPLVGLLGVTAIIVLVVLAGLFLGIVPTNIFAAAVEAAGDERQGGAAMAVIMVGQNAGMLLGPLVVGLLAETAGWTAAFASLAAISALGLLSGWLARVR